MRKNKLYAAMFTVTLMVPTASAIAQSLSATDILNLLVEEGVLSEEKASRLIEKVRSRESQSAMSLQETPISSDGSDVVRVQHVPQYVKDEIRAAVVADVRKEVTGDMIEHAKTEKWAMKEALPDWVNTFQLSGDMRLRYQRDDFPDNNPDLGFLNYNAINHGADPSSRKAFYNVKESRDRMRTRLRLNVKANPYPNVEVGMRAVTGSIDDPVSTNETMEFYDGKWDFNLDLAYLQYNTLDQGLMLTGGMLANPWLHTDLVWDSDVTFTGVAGSWHWLKNIEGGRSMWDPFVTAGVFPVDEINQVKFGTESENRPDDKWLYGFQFGTHVNWQDQSRLSAGLAYYHYDNITGETNQPGNDLQDSTAPTFVQKGNTMWDISADGDGTLYGLAAEYELLNATVIYDYAGFDPYHVTVTGDLVKNMAFDRDEVNEKFGIDLDDRDFGYQFGVAVGRPGVSEPGNWLVSFKYRHLEADAVLDAFADSDFLLGGTDAKGYILQADYVLARDIWMTMRWLSADEELADQDISVETDTMQLDLNVRF